MADTLVPLTDPYKTRTTPDPDHYPSRHQYVQETSVPPDPSAHSDRARTYSCIHCVFSMRASLVHTQSPRALAHVHIQAHSSMQHIHQLCLYLRLHAYSRHGSLARHACTAVSSMRIHTAACMFPPRLSRAARMHGSLARHTPCVFMPHCLARHTCTRHALSHPQWPLVP